MTDYLPWFLRWYLEGSNRSLLVSVTFLIMSVAFAYWFGYPELEANLRGPVEVSAQDLTSTYYDPMSFQRYFVTGDAVYDTGWVSEISSENSGEVISRHYHGVLEMDDKFLLVRSINPITPENVVFYGEISMNTQSVYEVINDVIEQNPSLRNQFFPVNLIERENAANPPIFSAGVIMTLLFFILALYGFYNYAVNHNKNPEKEPV